MVSRVRTIDFLPEIFKTKTNEQFLSATLDQLVQQPNHAKIQGYIGSRFGYGVDAKDAYVVEPTKTRSDYQLEPAVVFKKKDSAVAVDALTYPGIIDAIKLESGLQGNHNTLFNNEFYSWDSFVDLDKLINYGQYFWVPQGLEPVAISTDTLYYNLSFAVTSNSNTYSLVSSEINLDPNNPEITLVRGGKYEFVVNQDTPFWIQSMPGTDGKDATKLNINTRDILGVENNGISSGVITFNVPLSDDQAQYEINGTQTADFATRLSFDEVNGQPLRNIKGIDGSSGINGKTLIFYGTPANATGYISQFFDSIGFDSTDPNEGDFEDSTATSINSNIYKITLLGDPNDPVIRLTEAKVITNDTRINIRSGDEFTSRGFVRNSDGEIILLPLMTAKLDQLFYQDGVNKGKVGKIRLIDHPSIDVIDVDKILGQKTYTSPNGISFTNGLKVKFTGSVHPLSYLEDQYFVEGVGTSIKLIPVSNQIVPEPFGQGFSAPYDNVSYDTDSYESTLMLPYAPDYIVINRSSIDNNAWARSNRWFHVDVLKTIISNNRTSPIATAALNSETARAKRPIIEFYPNLKLHNSGTFGKQPVDYIDFSATNAFTQVYGTPSYQPDGQTSSMFDGARVIFANDSDPAVRNKIFLVNIAQLSAGSEPVITLGVAPDGHVAYNDQAIITKGEAHHGLSYYFDGSNWIKGQQKTAVNQPPKFDIFDNNNISLGDLDYYPGSDFTGCTLFEYAVGTGADDPILMFPIKYSGVNNLGDISFNVSLNTQTFNYVYGSQSMTQPVADGFVYSYSARDTYERKIGWQTAVEKSFQYQIFNLQYSEATMSSPTFVCDVKVKDQSSTEWPVLLVYLNNERLSTSEYTVSTGVKTTSVKLLSAPADGTPVEILVYSDQISSRGYYQIPANFDHNPFNEEVTSVNMGDIKGHYKSILNNVSGLVGASFGANNYRDLGNVIPYGTRIIQNSAPLVIAAAFLRNNSTNFFDAIQFNSNEYAKFKATLVDTVNAGEYTIYQSSADILDDVLDIMTSVKSEENAFFWSDMLPSKNPKITKTYTFKNALDTSVYPLSKVYDFTNANYDSVLVYLHKIQNGLPVVTQLIRGVDYEVSSTEKNINITKDLVTGDSLIIKEFDQTYGSYVPSTPTKLGFYPASTPEIVYDTTYLTPTYFIKGHDGSYTKLYGEYVDGQLIDFRDKVLFEFELRVFNNLKSSAKMPLAYEDIFPGQYRKTEYTLEQVQEVYSTYFLNWVGLNRLDYTSQVFDINNEFTWNYSTAISKADNKKCKQGAWRGLFLWLYDTINPDTRPWEMLGLETKPTWWDARYGDAPYTSDNDLLWSDLSRGFIWNNGDSYTDSRFARDGLKSIIPVDSNGKLIGPFTGVVASYDPASFESDWKLGDMSPTEYAYRKSSAWPFDLMRIFALTKPASFFTLGMDLDTYRYNDEFNQYLVNGRYRTTLKDTVLYGSGADSAAHSYYNWVVDYMQQFGVSGSDEVSNLLQSLDVRLAYRVAGFTDKNLIKFYIEKGTPNSKNNSLMIPDESYSVLLYDNQPNDSITYSSIIVQRSANGYRVYGNSQNKAYFAVGVPIMNGIYDTISVGNTTLTVPKEYKNQTTLIPYGTEFLSLESIANFIKGYGEALVNQGMTFDDSENGLQLDWNQMIAEFMYWVQTGWEVGSTVNINPCANSITIEKESSIVQPLTIHRENFILNQNLVPIQINDLAVSRIDTKFSAKVLNAGDSVGLFKANMSTIEHIVVFDNSTVFSDVLFNLVTGLRQQRIFVKGSKTAEWNGTINAAGFILNQDNVVEWQSNMKYTKGTIVTYKRLYYIANKTSIAPSETFNQDDWVVTDYQNIQKGLLPNPSTRAYESTLYYDTNRANLETDGDILGYSLIGYRPRPYLAEGNLDDISQINLFKNMIPGKGTSETVTALKGITLQQNDLDYSYNENWSIKTNEFGGVLAQNFAEFTLDENKLTGNPSIVSIIQGIPVAGSEQEISLSNIKNYGRSISDAKMLPLVNPLDIDVLPSAGYVNLDDISYTGYRFNNLNNADISYLYKNDYIWVADKKGKWDVYTPVSMQMAVTTVANNLNGTALIGFDKGHGLSQYDPFGIINFSSLVNGYYIVESVVDAKTVSVTLDLPKTTTFVTGNGLPFKLQSQRVASAENILALPLLNSDYVTNKVWVDKDASGNWEVLRKSNAYVNVDFNSYAINNVNYGSQVAYIPKLGYFVTDPGAGVMYKYKETAEGFILKDIIEKAPSFGASIAYNDDTMIVSAPRVLVGTDGNGDPVYNTVLYVYRIVQNDEIESLVEDEIIPIGLEGVGTTLEITGNSELMYVSIPELKDAQGVPALAGSVLAFKRNNSYTFSALLTRPVYDGSTLLGYTYVLLAQQINAGDKTFVVTGNASGYLPEGKQITFDQNHVHTVITGVYDADSDTTTVHITDNFSYTVPQGAGIRNAGKAYTAINYINSSFASVGDGFGESMTANHDGTKLFIGAPRTDFAPGVPSIGRVYCFDRLVQTWEVQYDSKPLDYYFLILGFAPDEDNVGNPMNAKSSIYVNGVKLDPSKYVIIHNLVIMNPQKAGNIITVSSNKFVLSQQLTSYENIYGVRPGQQFGFSLDCNSTGSELIVGAPFNIDSENREGAVYRFTNEGKRFGRITALVQANLQEDARILLNGQQVILPAGDAFGIAKAINKANIINVFAYATEDGRLAIRLTDLNLNQLNNKLSMSVFNGNYMYELGIGEYTKTQVIIDPHNQQQSQFGYAVKFNQYNSFAVGAPSSDRYVGTLFDYSNDDNTHNDTVFDNNLTSFEDRYSQTGSVYVYDYIQSYNESLLNPGQYVYSQSCNDSDQDTGGNPRYGSSLAFNDYRLIIGSPNFKSSTVGGKASVFTNATNAPGWSVYRKPSNVVNVEKIQRVQLYNNITDVTETALDYIDPLQGKLLGAVRENIDYIASADPAGYNNASAKGNVAWGESHVGKIWFDTTETRFVNYHQSDMDYNSKYWGKVFPGSDVAVYTWIESDVTPANYVGAGVPYDIERYSVAFHNDATRNLVAKYFYWVRDTNTLYAYQGKTLSDSVIAQYIQDPQMSGIPYMAALDQNVFGLYNAREFINGTNTNIHIGFSETESEVPNHAEFKLIRTNFPEDFLPGFPNRTLGYTEPSGLYDKLIDSFAGEDQSGSVIPDPYLPKLQQIGISVRPRQGFFVNRHEALRNYFQYTNAILATTPIREFGNLPFLHLSSDTFDVSKYWKTVYWWAEGYSDKTKATFEVAYHSDLQRLTPKEGLVVSVAQNSQGKREVYVYSSGEWSRIGVEDGTIEFLDTLWDYQSNKIGFGDNFFDTVAFDAYPSVETRYIVRSINEQIFTGPLYEYRNKSLTLMFEYIQSEATESNNYLPWLNKTSFIDVNYTVRNLSQGQKYKRDNENLISGYVNETKPYHVVIKDFFLKYNSVDSFDGDITDFDLPAKYNSITDRFETPVLVYSNPTDSKEFNSSASVWSSNDYTTWFNNYGLTLTDSPDYEITWLEKYIAIGDSKITVNSARGLPVQGVLKIGRELIGYSTVNRDTGELGGLTRGLENSIPSEHLPGATVLIDLPGVIVLDSSRNYIDPPTVTAYVDTAIYPAPRREAKLKAIMAGPSVVGVQILDPGEGYAVNPEIIISSSFEVTFTEDQINFVDFTVLVPSTELESGDLIKVTTTNGNAIPEGYYYVYVVATLAASEIISITLHKNFTDSIKGDNKIVFPGAKLVSVNNEYTFGLAARAIPVTTNSKTRSINTTMRFDRTSYAPRVVPWTPGEYWSSPYISIGNDTSSPRTMFYGLPYGGLLPSGGTGSGAEFTISNVLLGGTYHAKIDVPGTLYSIYDTLTVSGDELLGISPDNDCVMVVESVGANYIRLLGDTTTGLGTDARFNISMNTVQTAIDGTMAFTNGSTAVVGTASLFFTTLLEGDVIYVNGVQYEIDSIPIDDETHMTLTTPYTGVSESGVTAYKFTSTYTAVVDSLFYPGSGYAIADEIVISGTRLQGTSPENDLTITVTEITGVVDTGSIVDISVSGTPSGKGGIKTVSVVGQAVDANLASLQGAVLPLQNFGGSSYPVTSVNDQVVVRVNYESSGLKPGQIQGVPIYFYHKPEVYEIDDYEAAGGAYFTISKPRFNPFTISNQYFLQIGRKTNAQTGEFDPASFGTNYVDNDTPIVISGSRLGGHDGINDATIYITMTENGAITAAHVVGNAARSFDIYYAKPGGEDVLEIFANPGMTTPVPRSAFEYDDATTDFAYIPEPLVSGMSYKYNTTSYVTYEGKVWRCLDSNNSVTFDYAQWELVESSSRELNALDRIVGFYEPTVDMPSKDLQQLVKGITYPHDVYYGNSFSPEDNFPIDVVLTDQDFYPRDVDVRGITFDGSKWVAIADSAEHSIVMISYDGQDWDSRPLSDKVLGVTDILWTGESFIITTMSELTPMLLSFDAINWITVGDPTTFDRVPMDFSAFDSSPIDCPRDNLRSVFYKDDLYFATGSGILKSLDGITWEKNFDFNSQLLNHLSAITYVSATNFEGYVAVGGGNEVVTNADTAAPTFSTVSRVVTSIDGNNWTLLRPNTSTSMFNAVAASDAIIIAAGDNGEIWYSVNSTNWTQATTGVTASLLDAIYADNQFVVVGEDGTILVSSNGMSWTDCTNDALTVSSLYSITYDGTFYYAGGDQATVIRSNDGVAWADISYLTSASPSNIVSGSDFLYGYGPEELVAGVTYDSLSLKVFTSPGATWDDEETVATILFQNTGYNMATLLTTELSTSFDGLVAKPATIAVFLLDEATMTGPRITNYIVDWVAKTVTLNFPLALGKIVMIEAYEIGNGAQIFRSSSDFVPVRQNSYDNTYEMFLPTDYDPINHHPVLFKNGVMLALPTDYYVTFANEDRFRSKIVFITPIDPDADYVSFAILNTTVNDLNPTEFDFTIPMTEVFEISGLTYTLENSLSGTNDIHSIVEVDGIRLGYGTDYTINANTGVLTLATLPEADQLTVTTFNDTSRQYFQTDSFTAAITAASIDVQVSQPIDPFVQPFTPLMYFNDARRTWVTINGKRVHPDKLSFGTNNNILTINVPTVVDDEIIVTSMVNGATPDQMTFIMSVDRAGVGSVYRSNDTDMTWLTEDITSITETIYVNDVTKLMDTTQQQVTVVQGTDLYVEIATTPALVKHIAIRNWTTNLDVSSDDFVLVVRNGKPNIVLTANVTAGDILNVTIMIGDILVVNGEKIRFNSVDLSTNSVTQLSRGVLGTTKLAAHVKYSDVLGLTASRKLNDRFYNTVWTTNTSGTPQGDPLQISNSEAATFLKSGYY